MSDPRLTDDVLGRIRVAVFNGGAVTGPQVVALVDEVERLRADVARVRALCEQNHGAGGCDGVVAALDGDCPDCAASAGRCVTHAL